MFGFQPQIFGGVFDHSILQNSADVAAVSSLTSLGGSHFFEGSNAKLAGFVSKKNPMVETERAFNY